DTVALQGRDQSLAVCIAADAADHMHGGAGARRRQRLIVAFAADEGVEVEAGDCFALLRPPGHAHHEINAQASYNYDMPAHGRFSYGCPFAGLLSHGWVRFDRWNR